MATPLLHSNITFIFINIEALLFNPPVLSCHSFRLSDFLLAEMADSGPVSIIYGVVQTIIENLGSQIFQEIGKLYGVEKEIEKLRGTVNRIEAILNDAKEKQPHNHQVENWLKRLTGVVKEANDFLPPQQNAEGEFTEESREEPPEQNGGGTITGESREKTPLQKAGRKIKKEVCNFFSNSNQIAFYTQKKKNQIAFRYGMNEKLKKIRKELDAIVKDSKEFKLEVIPMVREEDVNKIANVFLVQQGTESHNARSSMVPVEATGALYEISQVKGKQHSNPESSTCRERRLNLGKSLC